MKNNKFTLKATIVSFTYWIADSVIHKFIYQEEGFELIPLEINELWMRIVIVVILICFGIYADKHTKSIIEKEKDKRIIFEATVRSTQHILNNLLNQMQSFKMEADEINAFDDEVLQTFENTILEGKELVIKLSSVEELTEKNIIDSVYPKNDK